MESRCLNIYHSSSVHSQFLEHLYFLTFADSFLRAHLRAVLHGVKRKVNFGNGPFFFHGAIYMACAVHVESGAVKSRDSEVEYSAARWVEGWTARSRVRQVNRGVLAS